LSTASSHAKNGKIQGRSAALSTQLKITHDYATFEPMMRTVACAWILFLPIVAGVALE